MDSCVNRLLRDHTPDSSKEDILVFSWSFLPCVEDFDSSVHRHLHAENPFHESTQITMDLYGIEQDKCWNDENSPEYDWMKSRAWSFFKNLRLFDEKNLAALAIFFFSFTNLVNSPWWRRQIYVLYQIANREKVKTKQITIYGLFSLFKNLTLDINEKFEISNRYVICLIWVRFCMIATQKVSLVFSLQNDALSCFVIPCPYETNCSWIVHNIEVFQYTFRSARFVCHRSRIPITRYFA